MRNVFCALPIGMAALILQSCGSSPKAPALSPKPLAAAEVSKSEDSIIGILPSGFTLETVPAKYTETTMNVGLVPAKVEYETIPAEFEWVEGRVEGFVTHYIDTTWSDTHTQTYLYKEASTVLVMVPPIYAENGNLMQSAMITEKSIPAIKKSYEITSWKSAGPAVMKSIPYEYKDGKTRVPISEPQTIEKTVPPVLKQVEIKKLVQAPIYNIRDETGQSLHNFETQAEVEAFLKSLETRY